MCRSAQNCNKTDSTQLVSDVSGPWLEIDLEAITHNILQIKKRVKGQRLMPVIKANAYGHGIVRIGRHLEHLNVSGLCVGKFQEAVTLRGHGVACPILNLGIFSKKEAESIVENEISQVIFSDHVNSLQNIAKQKGKPVRVHIKVDTGLGRIGVSYKDALQYIRNVSTKKDIVIEGIYTSLSEDQSFDGLQVERFKDICMTAEEEGIALGLKHVTSSAGILTFHDSFFDMVRPGIMVFGCYPSDREYKDRKIDLKPALTLKARAAFVKKIKAGDSVAYHRAYRAAGTETIITGGIGYADGYPLGLAKGGSVLIAGKKIPLIASITANHIYANAGDCDSIENGDEIVLIGCQGEEKLSIEHLAGVAGISEYQLLSGLNPALPRFYFQ